MVQKIYPEPNLKISLDKKINEQNFHTVVIRDFIILPS